MVKDGLFNKIKGCSTISIIGMDKNVGKTTVLNHIIGEARGKYTLGLTSIGWDGEDIDNVTLTSKPGIYVEKGTILATARKCLLKSDITLEIIKTTGMNTPLGEVIIARALSDGNVELAGPSVNSSMVIIGRELLSLGAYPVIMDGALSRKTPASPAVSQGTILSTGASLSRNMDKVVEATSDTVKLLSLKREEDIKIRSISSQIFEKAKMGMIYKDKSFITFDNETTMGSSKDIIEHLNNDVDYAAVKGVITDRFLSDIIKSACPYRGVTFIIEDGTKLFADRDTLYRFEKTGGIIKVLKCINLLCVTSNPKSPYGYEFDRNIFLKKLRDSISIPVYDVVGGD